MRAIGALAIEEGKILIVKDIQGWLFPGGKTQEGETDESCLTREFAEELSNARIKNIKPYKDYESSSTKHNKKVDVGMYFIDLEDHDVKPSGEVMQAIWTSTPEDYGLIPTARQIIQDLRKEGLL
ncbi:MAG: NUDIX hydrolase [Nanoarchaeota archaeon]